MPKRLRYVAVSVNWCHICGLPIPPEIVSRTHPLYGSVDHVIPKSKGGQTRVDNLRAAHLYCNKIKDDRDISQVDADGLQGRIKVLLEKVGVQVTRAMLTKARARRTISAPVSNRKGKHQRLPESIQRWDNEGGFVGNRTRWYDEPPTPQTD